MQAAQYKSVEMQERYQNKLGSPKKRKNCLISLIALEFWNHFSVNDLKLLLLSVLFINEQNIWINGSFIIPIKLKNLLLKISCLIHFKKKKNQAYAKIAL